MEILKIKAVKELIGRDVELICEHCFKKVREGGFIKHSDQFKQFFCSQECVNKEIEEEKNIKKKPILIVKLVKELIGEDIKLICHNCQKYSEVGDFAINPYDNEKRFFCSQKCLDEKIENIEKADRSFAGIYNYALEKFNFTEEQAKRVAESFRWGASMEPEEVRNEARSS